MYFRSKPIRTIALSAVALIATACPQDKPLQNGIVPSDETTTTIVDTTSKFSTPTYEQNGEALRAAREGDLQNFVVKCFSREKGNDNSLEISISPDNAISVFSNDPNQENLPLVNLGFDDGRIEPYGDVEPGVAYGFPRENIHSIEIVFAAHQEHIKISFPDSGVFMVQDSVDEIPMLRMKIYPEANRVVGYKTHDGVPVVARTQVDVDGTLLSNSSTYEKAGNMIGIGPIDTFSRGFTDQVVSVDNTLAERTCAVSHTQGLNF